MIEHTNEAQQEAPPTPPAVPAHDVRRRRVRWAVAAGVVLAVTCALAAWLLGRPEPTPESAPTSATPGAPAGPPLTWAPPVLEDPETIELTADNATPVLDDGRDYILELPDEPLTVTGGVSVTGGRNVVLIGGEIRFDRPAVEQDDGRDGRALFFEGQTGTLHVEGVLLSGPGLAEGVNLDEREGAVVQLQNLRVETVHGDEDGHHADVLQTWAGPRVLRVDRLSGASTYQGMFLLPQQFGDQAPPEEFDLRNVDLTGAQGSGYLLWRDDATWPIRLTNVWVSPTDRSRDRDQFLWARGETNRGTWDDVQVGAPPSGEFVPAGTAGVGYRSPGYLGEPGA